MSVRKLTEVCGMASNRSQTQIISFAVAYINRIGWWQGVVW